MNKKAWMGLVMAVLLGGGAFPVAAEEDSAAGWRERESLLGDWGGLRPRLEVRGLSYDLTYTFEYLWNVDGGLERGGDYRADLTLGLELDTEAAGWWANGLFSAQLQLQHGNSLSERYTGDFQLLSNMDADDFAQVSQLWYRHSFADGRFWLKVGKQDANEDFAYVDYGGNFSASSPGFNPTIPMVSYPDPDLGIAFGFEANDYLTLKLGVYQGQPDGGRAPGALFDNLHGPLVIFEPELHYSIKGHPGTLRAGAWWHGDSFATLRSGVEEEEGGASFEERSALFRAAVELGLGATFREALLGEINARITQRIVEHLIGAEDEEDNGTFGFYLNWDQEVYRENPDVEGDTQGIGIFAQAAWADGEVREVKRYLGLGLEWTGAIPRRDADVLGLGIFHAAFSEAGEFDRPHETAIELFYKAQLTPWFSVKPDVHYILNPGGSNTDDALVCGVRCEITF